MASSQPTPPSQSPPSYARPTQASQQRVDSKRPTHSPQTTNTKRLESSSPLKQKVLPSYGLSTISSRTKAAWPASFRFFNLPAELRNRIYEFAVLEHACRQLDTRSLTTTASCTHLPGALLCNKQMRDEAGGYYFPTGHFDVMVDCDRFDNFLKWLKTLGRCNLQHLMSNPHVTIRLVHSRRQCRSECQAQNQAVRKLNGCDSLSITGLRTDEHWERYWTYAALNNWAFKFDCSTTLTFDQHLYYHRRRSRDFSTISVSAIVRLRTVLKGIFAILDGEEPDLNDSQSLDWLQKSVKTPYSQMDLHMDLADGDTAVRQFLRIRRLR